jgi:hypothetical protein
MKKLNRLFLALALVMAVATSKAQEVSPVAFLRMNPYQTNTNVATDLPYYCYFSVGVGNFGASIHYPRFRFRDLFNYNSDDSPSTFDLVNFAKGLSDQNSVALNLNENIWTFAYRVGDGMLSFGHNYRAQASSEFGYSLFKLLVYGNESLLGEDNATQVNFSFDGQAYNEYAVGYQLKINKHISVGARAKLLFGIANVTTDAFDLSFFTDPDTYALHIREDIGMRFSLPRLFELTDDGLTAGGPFGLADFYHNPGLGFDLGINYRINNRFSVAAAVNDLGFIKWNQNNMELVGKINDAGQFYDDDTFVFEGLDVDQLQLIVSDASYRRMFLDTLKEYFNFQLDETGGYRTSLPTSFLVRGSIDVNEHNRFSAQFQGCFRSDGFQPAVTLAYGGSFFDKIEVSGTYTMMKGSLVNVGVGLGFNLGAFHIYGATSNLFNINTGGSKWRDIQAGIVFNLREKSDKIGTTTPDYF